MDSADARSGVNNVFVSVIFIDAVVAGANPAAALLGQLAAALIIYGIIEFDAAGVFDW